MSAEAGKQASKADSYNHDRRFEVCREGPDSKNVNRSVFLPLSRFSGLGAPDLSSQFVDEVEELAKHVHVSLVAEKLGDEPSWSRHGKIAVHRVRPLETPRLRGFSKILLYLADLFERGLRCDIVYIRTFGLPELLTLISAKLLYRKTVFRIPGTWIFEPPTIRNRLNALVFRLAVMCSDRVCLYSKGMVKPVSKYASIPRRKLRIVPNALNPERFSRVPVPKKDPTVLYVGRISESKGVHILIQSAKEVLMEEPNARFILIGNGAHEAFKQKMRQLIIDLRLEDRVQYIGPVPNSQLPEYYSSASVFAYPTLGGEGVTRAIMESLSCGTPVVATPDAGIPDVVIPNETGLLVPKNDVEALASAILEIVENPIKANKMGENGRRLILAKYTLEKTTPQLVSVITAVCS